jgi:sigma-B regulation protein RsbU (phosphoserine phosphatase)
MKTKRRYSLSFKLYLLIILLIFSCSCAIIMASYSEHARTIDKFYQDMTENLALTVSETLDGSNLRPILEAAHDSAYQEIRAKAVSEQDEGAIRDYLAQHDLLQTYDEISESLSQYVKNMDVEYIYLETFEDGQFCRLVDPDDGYYALGLIEDLDPPFMPYSGQNRSIPATLSNTEDGLLWTSYEPVYDENGTAVTLVGVDVSAVGLRQKHQRFALFSILNALCISLIAAAAGVFFMRRHVTEPIKELCTETRKFTDKKGQYTLNDVTMLQFQSHDEIEDLYKEIRSMERKIVRYLDHLIVVTGEKERTRTELSIAAQIQSDMLPSQFPAFPDREQDFDLYASMAPAKEVGGDFYDFFLVDDDHLALTIADVSGKGIPGAMFIAIVKSLLKNSVASNKDMAPSEVIASLNDRICQNNQSGLFVSVWLGILELSTGTLTACNAGHEYPVLSRKGQPFALMKDKHGLVMAAESGASYSDYQIVLAPGDRLFVYTDGVVEATNKKTELFGIDRMIEALNSDPKARPRELIEEVSAAVDEFVGSAPQFDDMTMLSITYKP